MSGRRHARRRRREDDLGEDGGAPVAAASSSSSDGDSSFSDSDASDDSGDSADAAPAGAERQPDGGGAGGGGGGEGAGGAGGEGDGGGAAFTAEHTFEPANFHLPPTRAAGPVSLAALVLPDPQVPALEALLRVDRQGAPGKRVAVRGSADGWRDGSVVEWPARYDDARQLDVQGGEAWVADIHLDRDAGWLDTGDRDESRKVLEFALRLTADDGTEEWDSNGGENYRVVVLRRRVADILPSDAALVPPDERITSWADERVPSPPSEEPVAVSAPKRGRGGAGTRGRGAIVPAFPSKTMLASRGSAPTQSTRGGRGRGGYQAAGSSAPLQIEILRKPKEEGPPAAADAPKAAANADADTAPSGAVPTRGTRPYVAGGYRGRGRGLGPFAGSHEASANALPPSLPPSRQFWGHDDRFAPAGDERGRGGFRGRGRGRGAFGGPAPTAAGGEAKEGDEVKSQGGGSDAGRARSQSPQAAAKLSLDEIPYGSGAALGAGRPRGSGRGRYQAWDPIDEKLLKERWPHDGFEEINAGPEPARRDAGAPVRGRGRGARAARGTYQPVRGTARPPRPSSEQESSKENAQNGVQAADRPDPARVQASAVPDEEPEIVVDFKDMEAGVAPVAAAVPSEAPLGEPLPHAAARGRGRGRGVRGSLGGFPERNPARAAAAGVPQVLPAVSADAAPAAAAAADAPAAPSGGPAKSSTRPSIIPQGNSMFQALAAAAQARGQERKAKEEQQKKRAHEREVRAKEELMSAVEAPEFTPTPVTPATPATRPSDAANRPAPPVKAAAVEGEQPQPVAVAAPPAQAQYQQPPEEEYANGLQQQRRAYRQPKPAAQPGPPPVPAPVAYGMPLAPMPPGQPTFYTAGGMVVQPMMTSTGQMVFMTENGLMVPGDASMYGGSYAPGPPMAPSPVDYGYANGGRSVSPSYMPPMSSGPAYAPPYYAAGPNVAFGGPADGPAGMVPMPPRQSRPVTLKAPPPGDGRYGSG